MQTKKVNSPFSMKWTPWEDLQLDMALLLFHQRFFDIQLLVVSQLLEGPLFQSSWALIFPGFPECCMADKYTLQHVLVTPVRNNFEGSYNLSFPID